MSSNSYYEVLGVPPNAGPSMITEAYRSLVKVNHPDKYDTASEGVKSAAEAKLKEINEAYEVLNDPQRRAEYDGHVRHPRSLLYVQRDIDFANGDTLKLECIAFSSSEESVRNQAATLLLNTDDLSVLSKIAGGKFSDGVHKTATQKVAQLTAASVAARIAPILIRGKYQEAIQLASAAGEAAAIREAGLKAAITLLDGAIRRDHISDEMIDSYVIGLVCGDLRSFTPDGEEHTISAVPIESRVAIGNKIIDYYKAKKEPKKLLKLAEEKSTYFPRELLGKCTAAAIEVYVEADNRNELLEMIGRSYKLRGSIDSVIDGVISIAQKAAPGSNNDFTRTAEAAIDKLEFAGESRLYFERLIIRIIDKTIELGDKRCTDALARYVQPQQARGFGFGGLSGGFGAITQLPYDVREKIGYSINHFRRKAEEERAKADAEAREAKQRAAAEARAAEAARIAKVAATCDEGHVKGLLTKIRKRETPDSEKKKLGAEVIAICRAKGDIKTIETIATSRTKDYPVCLVYPYEVAWQAQDALIEIVRENRDLDLLMRLARNPECPESKHKAIGELAVSICLETNNLPQLEVMATSATSDYPVCLVYPYAVSDAAQAALVKIGTETKDLPLLMRLAGNNKCHDRNQKGASEAAVALCVETLDTTNLKKMTEREGGYDKYVYARRRAEREIEKLNKDTAAVTSKVGVRVDRGAATGKKFAQ